MSITNWILQRIGLQSRWEIWLDDPLGNRLALVDRAVSFWIQRTANEIGAFQLVLPGGVYDNLLRLDGMVEFWRAPALGRMSMQGVGLCRIFEYADDQSGTEYTVVEGPDQNDLLDRRIVAFAAGSAQAEKSDQADDLIKAVANEAFGSSAGTGRNLSSLGVTIAANTSLGPTVGKAFSWRYALRVMQEVAEAARQQGTELYFDMVPKVISDSRIGFEFRTYVNQLGIDRTADNDNPVFFGKQWGNLENGVYIKDYSEERNYVYVGGQGEGSDRRIVEVSDTSRVNASPWNRREAFADARNESTTAGVTNKGRSVLEAGRPKLIFRGDLLDTRQARYGVEWNYGDRLPVQHRRMDFDGMVRTVRIGVDERGREMIEARIEVEE